MIQMNKAVLIWTISMVPWLSQNTAWQHRWKPERYRLHLLTVLYVWCQAWCLGLNSKTRIALIWCSQTILLYLLWTAHLPVPTTLGMSTPIAKLFLYYKINISGIWHLQSLLPVKVLILCLWDGYLILFFISWLPLLTSFDFTDSRILLSQCSFTHLY